MAVPAPVVVEVANTPGLLDWVIAGATLLAAIVPALLFLRERRDRQAADARAAESDRQRWEAEERYRREELERLQVQADSDLQTARRSKAEPVFAWLEVNGEPRPSPHDLANTSVVFSNESASPITRVWIKGVEIFKRDESGVALLEEGQKHTAAVDFYWYVVPPTRGRPLSVPLFSIMVHRPELPPPRFVLDHFIILTVDFTDISGVRWSRDVITGDLVELGPAMPQSPTRIFKPYGEALAELVRD